MEDDMAEHSGGARTESRAAGWEADEDRVRKKGYCTRSKEWTPANRVCTGFYWINDEYTPVIGCMTCKYWQRK